MHVRHPHNATYNARTLAFGVLFSPQDMLVWVTPGAIFGVVGGTLVCVAAACGIGAVAWYIWAPISVLGLALALPGLKAVTKGTDARLGDNSSFKLLR